MRKEKIKEKIEKLREELSEADQSIKDRIEPIINALENEFSKPENLVTELETKHPQLTEFVNRLSDLLSGLGI
jgi:predicted  nucleic acid-binding Zn-ribbon protein